MKYTGKKLLCFLLLYILMTNTSGWAQQRSTVTVEVNPEMELFSLVTYLSGNIRFVIPSSYETLVRKELRSFRRHPAVRDIRTLYRQQDVEIESVHPMLGFACTPLPELKPMFPPRYTTPEQQAQYLRYLRNFADEISFNTWRQSLQPEYQRWTVPVQDTIAKYALADRLGDFFGIHKSFKIHLDPFNSWGGQAFVPDSTFSDTHAYFRIGYNVYHEKSGPEQSPVFSDKRQLIQLVWHEGAHTYVNPRVQRQSRLFEPAKHLLNANLNKKLQRSGRFTWHWSQFLNEQVTRAVVAYLMQKHMGQIAWEAECRVQENAGFVYTRMLSQQLAQYDQQRDRYTDFSDFLPTLARVLSEQMPVQDL